jgi:hypothetical protein
MLGAGAVAPQPAAAQSHFREPYDSGPYGGPYGWSGRAGNPTLGDLDSEMGRHAREQFWRGYRAGRDDERAALVVVGRGGGGQEYGAAMEFLDLAQRRMDQGALRGAWTALGRAESRLATRALPEDADHEAAAGGAIGAIRAARQALRERDVELAQARAARATDLARSGNVVGRSVPGASLAGAGSPEPGQPLTGGGRGGQRGGSDRDD